MPTSHSVGERPAPVCFIQSFEFHIDAPTAAAGEEATVSQALADATLALTSGKSQQALELARPLALRGGAAADEAWRIVGMAACLTKNPREASASYGTARTRAYLDLLIEVCRRSGLTLQAGRFVGQPVAK